MKATAIARTIALSLSVVIVSLGGSMAVEKISYRAGVAYAQATPLPDSGAGSGSDVIVVSPAPTTVVVVNAEQPTPVVPEPPDVSEVTKLWNSGAILSALIVLAFLLLTVMIRLDRRRAFYYSVGIAGVGVLYEVVQAGNTPSGSMFVVALSTALAVWTRGPAGDPKPATPPPIP